MTTAADRDEASSFPVLTRRGQQRQQALLAVASEHFLNHGYRGVSLDAIVAEAGGSKGAIYRHFGNKGALFMAVVAHLCADFLAPLRAVDLSDAGLEDGLRTILKELVEVVTRPRHVAFYRLVVAGSAEFPEAGRTWYEHGPAVWFEVFKRLFDAQRAQGHVRADAPTELIGRMLFDAVLSGLTTQVVILGQPADQAFAAPMIEELIAAAVDRTQVPGH